MQILSSERGYVNEHNAWRAAWTLLIGLALLCIWGVDFLPMTDLPQHAGLIKIWTLLDSTPALNDVYKTNPFSPYWACYGLGYLLVHAVSLDVALKILVSAAVILYPVTTLYLLRQVEGADPWWALLGFAAAFNIAFYWGFLTYLIAVPLSLFTVGYAIRTYRQPSRRGYITLALISLLLFFSHGIAFGFAMIVSGVISMTRPGTIKERLVGCVPLFSALPFAIAWIVLSQGNAHVAESHTSWHPATSLLQQVLPRMFHHDAPTNVSLFLLACVVTFILVARPGIQNSWECAVPLLVTATLYLAAPVKIHGTSVVSTRLAVFFLPTFLLILRRSSNNRNLLLSRGLIVAAMAIVLVVHYRSFSKFNEDVGPLREAIAVIEPNKRVLALLYNYQSQHAGINPMLHFGAWCAAFKGGIVGYSFAEFPQMIVTYREGKAPEESGEAITWNPDRLRWEKHSHFDYFLVRITSDRQLAHFKRRTRDGTLTELYAEGTWHVYRNDSEQPAPASEAELPAPE